MGLLVIYRVRIVEVFNLVKVCVIISFVFWKFKSFNSKDIECVCNNVKYRDLKFVIFLIYGWDVINLLEYSLLGD